jgi:hypothetical protein
VHKLISWKHSYRKLNEEYKLAKKKRQVLDSLLDTGKISASTHDMFNREIDDALSEIENQRKALLEKMASKTIELENQIKTLEILLAKFEIQHVTDEIDEEIYQRETDLLSMGLETIRQELDTVQEATNQLSTSDTMAQQEVEPQPQENLLPQQEVKFLDEPEQAVEKEASEPSEEPVVAEIDCKTEAQQPEPETEKEEKQEA